MQDKNFYRAFEEKHRGTRELIKSRLQVYLPFVLPFKDIYKDDCCTFDIGCGRGEWLELMSENGFNAAGVDLDDGMLKACNERGLNAVNEDALLALQKLPDDSQVVISGFHIAEHLPFDVLLSIVEESKRVLKPGGLLILETPNAENIFVGTFGFYADPSHIRPLYNELLAFIMEYYGYNRYKILRLQESPALYENGISILDVYGGVSPDYSVIAQKYAPEEVLSLFNDVFAKEYGLSMETLCSRFEDRLEKRFASAEAKAQSAEAKAQSAEAKAQSAEAALNVIYASRSWKMTAPYRFVGDVVKNSKQHLKQSLKPCTARCVSFVIRHPELKNAAVSTLCRFPKIKSRLRRFYHGYYLQQSRDNMAKQVNTLPLTPHAQKIYNELKRELERSTGALK